jgi:peptidoglycan/LPS O-acetylase OafA/YrhL
VVRQAPDPAKNLYPALTSLRGIVSLWVVFLHSTLVVGYSCQAASIRFWRFFARPGFLGVDVFFILSGFVLSLGYGNWFGNRATQALRRRLRFVRNRASRIF